MCFISSITSLNGQEFALEPPPDKPEIKPESKGMRLLSEGQVKLVWAKAYAQWGRDHAEEELRQLFKERYKGLESTKDMMKYQLDDYLDYMKRLEQQ